jgi:hypothetical protein
MHLCESTVVYAYVHARLRYYIHQRQQCFAQAEVEFQLTVLLRNVPRARMNLVFVEFECLLLRTPPKIFVMFMAGARLNNRVSFKATVELTMAPRLKSAVVLWERRTIGLVML